METDRQTDSQPDRQTDRQKDSRPDKQTGRRAGAGVHVDFGLRV